MINDENLNPQLKVMEMLAKHKKKKGKMRIFKGSRSPYKANLDLLKLKDEWRKASKEKKKEQQVEKRRMASLQHLQTLSRKKRRPQCMTERGTKESIRVPNNILQEIRWMR